MLSDQILSFSCNVIDEIHTSFEQLEIMTISGKLTLKFSCIEFLNIPNCKIQTKPHKEVINASLTIALLFLAIVYERTRNSTDFFSYVDPSKCEEKEQNFITSNTARRDIVYWPRINSDFLGFIHLPDGLQNGMNTISIPLLYVKS